MSQTIAQAQAALDAAEEKMRAELYADIDRGDGSGAQEERREKYKKDLQDDISQCKQDLAKLQAVAPNPN